jgi:hypothetical protein
LVLSGNWRGNATGPGYVISQQNAMKKKTKKKEEDKNKKRKRKDSTSTGERKQPKLQLAKDYAAMKGSTKADDSSKSDQD